MKPSEFRIHDTVHYIAATRAGLLRWRCPSNHDMEDWRERVPIVRLDHTWPSCITDTEEEMKFPIETGMPVPSKHVQDSLSLDIRDTMSTLQIGQSFFVPLGDHPDQSIRRKIDAARQKFSTCCFVSRKTKTDPIGFRIWRLE